MGRKFSQGKDGGWVLPLAGGRASLVTAQALHPSWPQEIMEGWTDEISCSGGSSCREGTLAC